MSENLIIAGLDIGNGYVKGLASIPGQESTGIDIPSGILSRYVLDETDFRTPVDGIPAVMDDIYNQMDVIFSSPLISNGDRILFGRRAVATGRSLEEFDVAATRESKATKALSFILILGCLAGKALQVYWNEHGALPKDTIQYHVRMAVALPITEYKQYRQVFGNQFKTGSHVVTFYNFEQLVRVELVFDDVQVLAEGASAQYAILAKGEPLMNAMLDDLRAHGCPFEGITGADILACQGTIGIDIGEGTVNFPVYQNGKFSPDASFTLSKGYGTILTDAMEHLLGMGFPFPSRKALSDYMQTPVTPLTRSKHDAVDKAIGYVSRNFAMEVRDQFSKLMSRVGMSTEVVYVYGGGASPVKDVLYPMLLDIVNQLGHGEAACPVLYLDSQYSRKLNREGLYMVAEQLYEYDAKKG